MINFKKILKIFLCILVCSLFFHTSHLSANYYSSGKSYFPNNKDFYIVEQYDKNNWHFIINNEKKFDAGNGISQITLSKDSNFFVFTKKEKERYSRITTLNGEDQEAFIKISNIKIFKEDYAYIGNNGRQDLLVYNGKIIEKFERIKSVAFHNGVLFVTGVVEGKHVSYTQRGGINSEQEHVGGIYHSINNQRAIIPIKRDNKWFLSENSQLIHENGSDLIMNIQYSSNEKGFYYTVKEGSFWFILNQEGKIVGEKSPYIPQFKVSADSEKVAYTSIGEKGNRTTLYINGKIIGGSHSIAIHGWDNGGTLHYTIKNKKMRIKILTV